MADLEVTNARLENQLARLSEEYKCVLDHSVESDQRLLQYTDQIFLANSPTTESSPRPIVTDCAVQCELPTNASCQDPRCVDYRDLISSLKTTIQVLEAEVECLKAEAKTFRPDHSVDHGNGDWVVCQGKQRTPITLKNKFQPLSNEPSKHPALLINSPAVKKPTGKSRMSGYSHPKHSSYRKPKIVPATQTRKEQLPFKQVIVEGDSHARCLAGLVKNRVSVGTAVSGVCKPGAKLLDVTSSAPPPPESCCVLFVGTNDIAADELNNIYQHLERKITERLTSARVVIGTIPYRYDLPADHPVNQRTVTANYFIEELCARLKGVEILDFNTIGRRWFTRHGMHLRFPGKKLLADLVIQCLLKAGRPRRTPSPPVLPFAAAPCRLLVSPATSTRPITLPHDTYADAVKVNNSSAVNVGSDKISFNNIKNGVVMTDLEIT